ncbi:hypothetical protein PRIPAC_79020 [Pristionchus pacificus]|uniref:Uncharacterized protein n=1 Tax=Pristionchus pacificus TaxID=54126 RepID=A0A2A6CQD0_PRIPA|nr:hypothetical protein PRIPAC_79020 [Pristionchus pacificus]|eukprot:PDM80306.1 hypothetical protein PRIPAC_32885 [Pristionchus pacificus]
MFRSLFATLLAIFFLSPVIAQWGWNRGYGNNGGTEIIERDIVTTNNGWGGSTTVEKDEIIDTNNGGWGK